MTDTEQLQHDWERYKNRLRSHWAGFAKSYPQLHPGMTDDRYARLVYEWYKDAYLSEPMSPGQEYANNH